METVDWIQVGLGLGLGFGLGRQSCTHDWDLVLGSVVYIAFAIFLILCFNDGNR